MEFAGKTDFTLQFVSPSAAIAAPRCSTPWLKPYVGSCCLFADYPMCSTSSMTSSWWSPLSFPSAYGLCTLFSAFQRVCVPLSPKKSVGPSTSLEFLGIELDSVLFQASLPPDKLECITTALSEFVLQPCCSKLQPLSLLGHLSYAVRIIPQGRSFISHLLSIASSVPSLQHRLSLGDACISELRFWLFLLQHWNGISFFYEDTILKENVCQIIVCLTFHKLYCLSECELSELSLTWSFSCCYTVPSTNIGTPGKHEQNRL